MTVSGPTSVLHGLRLRLTAWYVGTFVVILAVLGGGLFATIRGQISRELDLSLSSATAEIARAAATREVEAATVRGQVVDAVEELRIPDRQLYLFDRTGAPLVPAAPEAWIHVAAQAAARDSLYVGTHRVAREHSLRIRAERFTLGSGTQVIAVASADRIELDDRYASLIAAFGAAAAAGLVLVGVGGWLLMRKSTEPAEAAMERMRRFMADAAHELRTPVTVLRSRADVALQRPRGEQELTDTVRVMGSEATRLGRIVDDLMTLARADAGERPVERRRLALDDVVLTAADAARVMADMRGVALDVGSYEEAWVDGDEGLLHQLLMILLDNGIKFTPEGGRVTVAVGVSEGRPTASVRDTGPGIAPADLSRIFERFFRGDVARARAAGAAGGAGLGLAIAKWIADAHGATIAVQSTPGQGAEFRVAFPSAPAGGNAT
ncbi:MAG TPA: HAMP domain-containing sensor histidine kinase [Gemmatimonadaceae bacterium]|nr:HAMP domain-containing sensor histidine kinase [Gemmatimonadaceae bacterium]